MKKTGAFFVFFVLTIFFFPLHASAADFYVSPEGGDVNAGTEDSPFKTIGKCIETANCGDVCHVKGGEYFENFITISKSCSVSAPLIIRGESYATSIWHAGAAGKLENCEKVSGRANTWRCPVPSGADSSFTDDNQCFQQKVIKPVRIEDHQGMTGDMTGYVCLTMHTSDDVEDVPGSYTVVGGSYYIHGWGDESPQETGFYPPRAEAASKDYCLWLSGSHIVIENFTIVAADGYSLLDTGTENRIGEVVFYGGTLAIGGSSNKFNAAYVKVFNNARRPVNGSGTTGTAWDKVNQSMWVKGHDFDIKNLELYAGREGLGFSDNAGPGKVRGLKIHLHYNHNYKFIDNVHDIDISNCWSYNSQESLFIGNCATNITHRNCTFPEPILVHDNVNGSCANNGKDGPVNLDFYNSIIYRFNWLSNFGDPRENGGHDMDYNVYLTDNANGAFMRHMATGHDFNTIGAWQNWDGDPCPNCTRDPHSKTSTTAAEFVKWNVKNDKIPWSDNYDFHLNGDAVAVDAGSPSYASDVDMENKVRSDHPDAGAWEFGGGEVEDDHSEWLDQDMCCPDTNGVSKDTDSPASEVSSGCTAGETSLLPLIAAIMLFLPKRRRKK